MRFHIIIIVFAFMLIGQKAFGESVTTFETKGTFKLAKGVKIKKGARLKVVSSEINY